MEEKYNNFLEFCALENAIKFKGKANPKALIGKILAKYPLKKNDMKSLMGEINTICDKINKLNLENQNKEFLKYNDLQKEKEDSLDIKKKIKAIVFDVDGVIFNTEKVFIEILEKHLKKNGIEIDNFREKNYLYPTSQELLEDEGVKKEVFNKIYDGVSKEFFSIEKDEILNIKNFIKNKNNDYLFFINTAMPKWELDKKFEKYKNKIHFKKTYTKDEGNKDKNILNIIKENNLKNDEVLFLDDKIINIENTTYLKINQIRFTEKHHNLNLEEEIERIEKILNFNELEK